MERDGPQWKPPEYTAKKIYNEPGANWRKESCCKIRLLGRLNDCLKEDGLVDQPMSFQNLINFLNLDNTIPFDDRVFIYLIGLVLHTRR